MTTKAKTTTTKKPTTTRTAQKKAVAPTVEKTEVVETAPLTETVAVAPEVKPTRAKKVQVDHNDMIECRSVTDNRLIYVSTRSRDKFIWSDFNAVVHLSMGELLTMKSSQPTFLNDVRIVIEDEEAVEYLGLTKLYESMVGIDDLDAFFDQSKDELAEVLPKLSKGLKRTVANRARTLIEEDMLTDISKIRVLEDKLDVDLKLFIK